MSTEPDTLTLERERLLPLLERTVDVPLAHTVPRDRLIHRAETARMFALEEATLDTDLRPSLSPLVVIGVIAMLLGLFFAVMHAS